MRHDGRGAGPRRQARPPRRADARHRQGAHPRDRRLARRHRRRLRAPAGRVRGRRQRHRRPPHRRAASSSPYAYLVAAADAMSGARPGARRQTEDNYVRKLDDLERIAASFRASSEAFAVQGGREVRVYVQRGPGRRPAAPSSCRREIAARISRRDGVPRPDQGHRHPRAARRRGRVVNIDRPPIVVLSCWARCSWSSRCCGPCCWGAGARSASSPGHARASQGPGIATCSSAPSDSCRASS